MDTILNTYMLKKGVNKMSTAKPRYIASDLVADYYTEILEQEHSPQYKQGAIHCLQLALKHLEKAELTEVKNYFANFRI